MLNYFSKLIEKINQLLDHADHRYQSDLEKYLLSKNPGNAAEADLWIRIYNREVIGRNSWM
jgi:hypothetical protein